MGCPGLEGAQGDMDRKDSTALGEKQSCVVLWQEKSNNQQEAGRVEEIWGGGSYLLDPGHLLGSSQREEKCETEFELEVAFESIWSHFRGEQNETQKYQVMLTRTF